MKLVKEKLCSVNIEKYEVDKMFNNFLRYIPKEFTTGFGNTHFSFSGPLISPPATKLSTFTDLC